jgi:hypothetical protein
MSTDVSEVRAVSYITSDPIALVSLITVMMEAARTSETSVDIQLRTRQYIPEDSELLFNFMISICLQTLYGD